MTTYDNKPASEQPDWAPGIGVLCGGCGSRVNACGVTEPCCSRCTHHTHHPVALAAPLGWDGDQA